MTLRSAVILSVALGASSLAWAQAEDPPLRMRTDKSGTQYVQGGVGTDEMNAVKALQGQYPLSLVFSGDGGEYIVPTHVTITSAGRTWLDVSNAGPAVLARLPAGHYTVQAEYGGVTQKRDVDVTGKGSKVVGWRFNKP